MKRSVTLRGRRSVLTNSRNGWDAAVAFILPEEDLFFAAAPAILIDIVNLRERVADA